MKTLTKLMLYFSLLCPITLTSCVNFCKPIERPEDLQPIDWENYNDVKTVYWNNLTYCSDAEIIGRTGKQIKVCGWIHNPYHGVVEYWDFNLINDSLYIYAPNTSNTSTVRVQCFISDELDRLKNKFDTTDITKKCYVYGELVIFCLEQMGCSRTAVEVFVESSDSIYFEK